MKILNRTSKNFVDLKDDLMMLEKIFHPNIQEKWKNKLELLETAKTVLLCYIDNKVIGEAYTIDAEHLRNDNENDDSKHLNKIADLMEKENAVCLCSLAVLPEYEGQGIATELMEMIISDSKQKGYTAIYSHAHEGASEHLHKKLGGKEILKRENWGNTGETYILYKIELKIKSEGAIMNYKLTKEDHKKLTEFLGKCWHEIIRTEVSKYETTIECKKCGRNVYGRNYQYTKTYTTPDEQHEVFKKLVHTAKWFEFLSFARKCYADYLEKTTADDLNELTDLDFSIWLRYYPERFNKLVSEYLKEIQK